MLLTLSVSLFRLLCNTFSSLDTPIGTQSQSWCDAKGLSDQLYVERHSALVKDDIKDHFCTVSNFGHDL